MSWLLHNHTAFNAWGSAKHQNIIVLSCYTWGLCSDGIQRHFCSHSSAHQHAEAFLWQWTKIVTCYPGLRLSPRIRLLLRFLFQLRLYHRLHLRDEFVSNGEHVPMAFIINIPEQLSRLCSPLQYLFGVQYVRNRVSTHLDWSTAIQAMRWVRWYEWSCWMSEKLLFDRTDVNYRRVASIFQ